MVSRTADWLRQSERNLASAQLNHQYGLYEEACYESQQAGEKAVKALLNYFHKEVRGHSLVFLIQAIEIKTPDYVLMCMQELDKQYIPSRYPDVYDTGAPADYYNKFDSERCIECARKIIDWVRGLVT